MVLGKVSKWKGNKSEIEAWFLVLLPYGRERNPRLVLDFCLSYVTRLVNLSSNYEYSASLIALVNDMGRRGIVHNILSPVVCNGDYQIFFPHVACSD